MRYSPESLLAFVQTVESGSFSAAARTLRKSQSTVSTAVANLEDDLGFLLFERTGRQPVLTAQGKHALQQVREILAASERLDELAVRMATGTEPCLSMAISDFWQANHHALILRKFATRYPDIEFDCMIAEDADIIDLLQPGRIHIGIIRAQSAYPGDIAAARLQVEEQMAIFIRSDHPLTRQSAVSMTQLDKIRQLRLNTWGQNPMPRAAGANNWSAPSYFLLLEMAEQGFGWAILPLWMVTQFGHQKLTALNVSGWPQSIALDAIWSVRNPPGPAGRWMLDQLIVRKND
ncbi:LysR family transcriptional regulator [Enterobacteriaceae bacterium LUAb1]